MTLIVPFLCKYFLARLVHGSDSGFLCKKSSGDQIVAVAVLAIYAPMLDVSMDREEMSDRTRDDNDIPNSLITENVGTIARSEILFEFAHFCPRDCAVQMPNSLCQTCRAGSYGLILSSCVLMVSKDCSLETHQLPIWI